MPYKSDPRVKPIRPHDQGVPQFVDQNRQEHGHDPGQHRGRSLRWLAQHQGHQPEQRVDPDGDAQQREVQIVLGWWVRRATRMRLLRWQLMTINSIKAGERGRGMGEGGGRRVEGGGRRAEGRGAKAERSFRGLSQLLSPACWRGVRGEGDRSSVGAPCTGSPPSPLRLPPSALSLSHRSGQHLLEKLSAVPPTPGLDPGLSWKPRGGPSPSSPSSPASRSEVGWGTWGR